jgi:hypothetical protein
LNWKKIVTNAEFIKKKNAFVSEENNLKSVPRIQQGVQESTEQPNGIIENIHAVGVQPMDTLKPKDSLAIIDTNI